MVLIHTQNGHLKCIAKVVFFYHVYHVKRCTQTKMNPRRAARFCHNHYKTIEKGCVSEMIGKLNLGPLNIRRTNRRLTIFHKAINGHLTYRKSSASLASHSTSQ